MRRRLDSELVRRRLADSRASAVRLIEAGLVLVGGAPADKPARLVSPGEAVTLAGPPPRFVSRGGEKLQAALERFQIPVRDALVLDAGASTGGFTDCVLQAGARRVVAVDVGRGQLHERIRQDPRVEAHERTDIREFASSSSLRFPVIVADLSFISLRSVAPALSALAAPGAHLVVLIKPQFEAGRAEASRGRGVIRDPVVWRRAVLDAITAIEAAGAANMGVMVSPLRGADGNVEFLAHFVTPRAGAGEGSFGVPSGPFGGSSGVAGRTEAAVDAAVGEAVAAVDEISGGGRS